MEETLRGIEARNPRPQRVLLPGVRRGARGRARGRAAASRTGPLHGVPTALKDLFDFKPGWPATMGGIRALADYRPPFACAWCERMEAAGAIIVGKTNSPAMGLRGTTDNYLFGPTRNPWDTSRNAGGSSGGAAAAVADGMLTIAEGTDGGGSVRIPAAWCGVYGYKQSWGRGAVGHPPERVRRDQPVPVRGRDHAHGRRCRARDVRARRVRPARPVRPARRGRLRRGARPRRRRLADRLQRRPRRLPGRPADRVRRRRRGARVRGGRRARRAGDAGAHARPARAERRLVAADHAGQHRDDRRAARRGLRHRAPTSRPSTCTGSTSATG